MIGTTTLIKAYDAEQVEALPMPEPIVPFPSPPPPLVSDAALVPSPMLAPSFEGQFLGKGGTPFGVMPRIYITPLPPAVINGGGEILRGGVDVSYPFKPRAGDPEGLVPPPVLRPRRPGEDAIVPVPTGQQPTKPPLPVTQPQITPVAPVTGKVGGFDLAKVPFWAWLVAAAVVGAKLLK